MRKKGYIYFMLLVSVLMLAVPLVPHHHHADGAICMKNDIESDPLCTDHHSCTDHQQCPGHHHHHPENDACCGDECLTRLQTPVPASQVDLGHPDYVFVALLFTDYLIEHLFSLQERRIDNNYVFLDSLHGTNITRAFALRGPPCLFV